MKAPPPAPRQHCAPCQVPRSPHGAGRLPDGVTLASLTLANITGGTLFKPELLLPILSFSPNPIKLKPLLTISALRPSTHQPFSSVGALKRLKGGAQASIVGGGIAGPLSLQAQPSGGGDGLSSPPLTSPRGGALGPSTTRVERALLGARSQQVQAGSSRVLQLGEWSRVLSTAGGVFKGVTAGGVVEGVTAVGVVEGVTAGGVVKGVTAGEAATFRGMRVFQRGAAADEIVICNVSSPRGGTDKKCK